jgi:hypothetical protein
VRSQVRARHGRARQASAMASNLKNQGEIVLFGSKVLIVIWILYGTIQLYKKNSVIEGMYDGDECPSNPEEMAEKMKEIEKKDYGNKSNYLYNLLNYLKKSTPKWIIDKK